MIFHSSNLYISVSLPMFSNFVMGFEFLKCFMLKVNFFSILTATFPEPSKLPRLKATRSEPKYKTAPLPPEKKFSSIECEGKKKQKRRTKVKRKYKCKMVPKFVKAGFAQGRFVRHSAAFISWFVQIIICSRLLANSGCF